MNKIAVWSACGALLVMLLPAGCSSKGRGTSYIIEGDYDPAARTLSARMTATVVNTSENALDALKFELYPNAYREGAKYPPVGEPYTEAAYYSGFSYGGIDIESVEGGVYEVCGEDENILSVTLPEPLYPDERAAVTVKFTTTLPEIHHRLGAGEHAVNLSGFYPVLCPLGKEGFDELVYAASGDPFVTACADYSVRLRVPAGWEVFGAEREGETFVLQANNIRDVAFVLAQDYECETAEVNGVKVKYCHPKDGGAENALKAATDSLAFYSETFSPYAYPTYWVVHTDFPYGGMEYPMLSMISLSLREEEIPAVVAHETAHQWWYAMVGSDQFNEAWQDEGLAEYSVALLAERDGFFGDYRETVERSERAYRAYFSVYSQVCGGADTRMTRPLTEYSGLYEYRSVAYDKGVILFDRIRTLVGEKKFAKAIRTYAEKFEGKIASSADMVSCFSAVGAHVSEIFTSFTQGTCVI